MRSPNYQSVIIVHIKRTLIIGPAAGHGPQASAGKLRKLCWVCTLLKHGLPLLPPSLPPVMTAAEKSHAEKIITLEITRSPNNITRIGPRLSNVHLSHLPRGGRREEERGERGGERRRKGEREGCFIKRFHVLINDRY